jgi:hypothetical protein
MVPLESFSSVNSLESQKFSLVSSSKSIAKTFHLLFSTSSNPFESILSVAEQARVQSKYRQLWYFENVDADVDSLRNTCGGAERWSLAHLSYSGELIRNVSALEISSRFCCGSSPSSMTMGLALQEPAEAIGISYSDIVADEVGEL